MIIAVDFDGTLCEDKHPAIGAPKAGAVEAMKRLNAEGHYLIVWTCRTDQLLLEAVNWLLEQGIPFDRINDHNPENLAKYGGSGGKKIFADVYVDDRNVGGFLGWETTLSHILE